MGKKSDNPIAASNAPAPVAPDPQTPNPQTPIAQFWKRQRETETKVNFWVKHEEMRTLRMAAASEVLNLSAWARRVLLKEAQRVLGGGQER